MARRKIRTYSVCLDCFDFAHHGDENLEPPRAREIEKAFLREEIHHLSPIGEDWTSYFSWSPCEICRSHLGGERIDCSTF